MFMRRNPNPLISRFAPGADFLENTARVAGGRSLNQAERAGLLQAGGQPGMTTMTRADLNQARGRAYNQGIQQGQSAIGAARQAERQTRPLMEQTRTAAMQANDAANRYGMLPGLPGGEFLSPIGSIVRPKQSSLAQTLKGVGKELLEAGIGPYQNAYRYPGLKSFGDAALHTLAFPVAAAAPIPGAVGGYLGARAILKNKMPGLFFQPTVGQQARFHLRRHRDPLLVGGAGAAGAGVHELVDDDDPDPVVVKKSAWSATGDGSRTGVFIRLPEHLTAHLPASRGPDDSPAHITMLSIGKVEPYRQAQISKIIQDEMEKIRDTRITFGGMGTFKEGKAGVPHFVKVAPSSDLLGARRRIVERLRKAGIEPEDHSPDEWKPHVTIEYRLPGS